MGEDNHDNVGLSREELRRLVFACLRPSANLAEEASLSLAELKALVELAYYQRARRSGLKMRQITGLFDIGMTKAAELSKDLKEHFLAPERQHGIGRQILSLLWSEPLSSTRIERELPAFSPQELEAALAQLVAEGRVVKQKGRTQRFAVAKAVHRLSLVPWMARVDGLNTLMDHVHMAINARFMNKDERALVRNVAFRVTPQSIPRLKAFYEEALMKLILELDEEAHRSEDSVSVRLSILWTPEED